MSAAGDGPCKLYVVRGRLFGEHQSYPLYTDGRMEGAFTSREAAEAFREEREAAWRRLGDREPLYWMEGWQELLGLSDFEEPVFLDWLADAGIPPPPPGER